MISQVARRLVPLTLIAPCALVPLTPATASSFKVLGSVPGGPVIGAVRSGLLYGTTPAGYNGASTAGSLFSLSTGGAYTLLRSLNGSPDGNTPNGRLAIDTTGNIYGTARYGGGYGGGTLWEYSTAGAFTTLHAFGNTGDGAYPLQGPTIDAKGNLYGADSGGAINTDGSVFRLSAAGKYSSMYDFLSGTDGHCPFSGVAVGKGAFVYGTTVGYGSGGLPLGSVFKLSKSGQFTTLVQFTGGADGDYPDQAPIVDKQGNVYGTNYQGNQSGFAGAVWTINTITGLKVLYDFNGNTDGSLPNSPLVLGRNGTLYGTTEYGGPGGAGSVFAITPSGTLTVLHAFTGASDGANPTGNLAIDPAGALYGGTATGQIFKIVP